MSATALTRAGLAGRPRASKMTRANKMIQRHDDSPVRSMLRKPAESATTWLVFGKTARVPTTTMTIANDTLLA